MSYFLETSFYPENISLDDELFDFNKTLDPKGIKNAALYLTNSFKQGEISEEVFQKLIETLLAFYIEQRFEQKLFGKKNNFITHFLSLQG
ncbi:MAG: hypothetical protein K9I71_12335 [Ignavibacteriales bacterium]|nr:hypothetical protein [Ignavibacteriales bacterium]MCF8438526.1 hypothetical protein [Ignavibacteriales bacterium]